MNILVLHNAYQQRGGEDTVVASEVELLRRAGHHVELVTVANDGIKDIPSQASAFLNAPYDARRATWAADMVQRSKAEIVHVHNFFPLLTPAVHDGASRAGAAVVQTLHNYRLLCGGAMFLRDGRVCEKCLKGSKLWSVAHGCYRDSALASLAVARMQMHAQKHGTWAAVDRFIALTHLARDKFVEGGIPTEKIAVKPNFTYADKVRSNAPARAGALFVGRLSIEKGANVLLDAWRSIPDQTLTIVGDGPERTQLEATAPSNVRFLGALEPGVVRELMSQSRVLVVPSLWPEMFGLVVIEAFSTGLPVIASRIGALQEIVREGKTGWLVEPGSSTEISSAVLKSLSIKDDAMNLAAKDQYNKLYSPENNGRMLEEIYYEAIANRNAFR